MADQAKKTLLPKRYKPMNDYTVQTQLDTRGREKQVPVYIGPYLRAFHSDAFYRRFRILVLVSMVLILASALVLLSFDSYAVYPNDGLYTLIPLIIALFPFVYLLLGFIRLPRENGRVQRDTYVRSVLRIRHSCAAIAIAAALSVVLWIVFLFIIHFQGLSWWDALFAGALLIVLCSSLLVFLESRKFSYELEETETSHELQDAERARSKE